MMYATALIKSGQSDYVKQYLWTGDSSKYNGGAIKFDLDWVLNDGYKKNSCDLWEEVQSDDFFWNQYMFRKAMVMGSEFASSMGDSATADRYQKLSATLKESSMAHWNGAFVQEADGRTKDGAVIVAFNDGYISSDPVYCPTCDKVASTIKSYINLFCQEYSINQKDYQNGIGGVLFGRYHNDKYAGGNPWILTTAALAQLYYNGATMLLEENTLPTAEALHIWKEIFGIHPTVTLSTFELAQVFASAGDGVLERIRHHVAGDNFHLDEQLDRNTGAQMSAKDLTWSYAETLMAMTKRDSYELAKTKYLQSK